MCNNAVNNNGGFTPNPPVMQLNLVNLSATNMPLNSQAQVASGYSDLLITSLVGDGLIYLAKHEVQSNNANSCKFNCAPKLLETSNQLVANECPGLKNSLMNSLIKKEDDFRGVVLDANQLRVNNAPSAEKDEGVDADSCLMTGCSFQVAVALQTPLEPKHVSSTSELGTPPISGLFGPIEISPSVLPRYPYPGENLAPMYPTFPTIYEPNLTGKCPVNFTTISNVIDRTASDCSQPLAALVGNVICCPQLGSLLHIFQGYFSGNSDKLVLQYAVADDCFSDIISILASRGANITIPTLCSVKSLNLTGGLCPVKDVVNFEKIVNTSKLLEACSTVDPLNECCRPICQSAIMEAALEISGTQLTINGYKDSVTVPNHNDPLSDCKGVAFSYISRMLSADAASSAFRIVSACKVNKEGQVAKLVQALVAVFLTKLSGELDLCSCTMKKRKVKKEQERKKLEAEKAKDEELSRKRKREERRERYRVQEKMKKKSRRNSDA
uniref:SPARK domain-containing protein n=1 Tax=Salix viminalis TaxID=40686 RepID=A0A6N2LD74_SALVM